MPNSLFKLMLRARGALAWRLHRLLGDRVVYGALLAAARHWRRAMRKPVFIAVAGSAGKTTAKELMLGMLSHQGRGVGNVGSFNNIEEIAKALLRVRPSHHFFVTELSEDRPGVMDQPLALLRPSVGIVTVLGDDHLASFESRDAIAMEMGKLLVALPATGTAVLNADDPAVLAMAANTAAKVITYGKSPSADLRAEDIRSTWPERLQLTLVHGSDRMKVETQLCGTHWVPSVLGAIGGALAAGMTLEECAAAIATVESFEGRMQPVVTAEGVTFIRDDFKAPLWTLDACFQFMRDAIAKRKIVVIGELQEVGPRKAEKYVKAALASQEIADLSIFIGPWASSAFKAQRRGNEGRLRIFSHVRDASAYINSIVEKGDLVLLKGANKQDHLFRIILAGSNDVACWRDDCGRQEFCNVCPDRLRPSGLAIPRENTATPLIATNEVESTYAPLDGKEEVIIGLGNPGPQFDNTPHNVGYAVVERIAASMGLDWQTTPSACIARGVHEGQAKCLVKISTAMNMIGPEFKLLSEKMNFGPHQCVLVFDDLDLPLGSIRMRKSGSAGGHRGVASILEAFQTDAFRRIKVGVRPETLGVNRVDYVVTAFAVDAQKTIDAAVDAAKYSALNDARAL